MEDLPCFSTFKAGYRALYLTESIVFSSKVIELHINKDLPCFSSLHANDYTFYQATSLILDNLPSFNTFNLGNGCFYDTTRLTISSMIYKVMLIRCSI